MNAPTDPLPEPLYWYEYTPTGWGAKANGKDFTYAAWTFNPRMVNVEWAVEGYGEEQPDLWVVRSRVTSGIDGAFDAVFPTREEATRYISVRAMLGTFELTEE